MTCTVRGTQLSFSFTPLSTDGLTEKHNKCALVFLQIRTPLKKSFMQKSCLNFAYFYTSSLVQGTVLQKLPMGLILSCNFASDAANGNFASVLKPFHPNHIFAILLVNFWNPFIYNNILKSWPIRWLGGQLVKQDYMIRYQIRRLRRWNQPAACVVKYDLMTCI